MDTKINTYFFVKSLFVVGFVFLLFPSTAQAYCEDGSESSIQQYGITWTFDKEYQCGQFVNGDYWVVDPGSGVKINNINPGDVIRSGTTQHMNGSMLNPSTGTQGYDGHREYDATKNVGIGISAQSPLLLSGDVSLVSTISNLLPGGTQHVSYVKTAAVLTCLRAAPRVNSFRPGISAPTKTIHNADSLDYGLLGTLASPVAKPDLVTLANKFQMVWLDHGGWTTRFMRPSDSGLDNYYYTNDFTSAELSLQLDYTNKEKEKLLINYIQFGIDMYSYLESGAKGWPPDGGLANGRKWPIMFAGIMLNYAPMKNIGSVSGDYLYANGYGAGNPPPDYKHFGEDGQTFYVAQSDVDITNGPKWNPDTRSAPNYPYTTEMLGMPEWGIRYSTNQARSDSDWTTNYRTIGTGARAWAGTSMAIRIMGAKNLWNHDAYFDYVDRYMAISKGDPDPSGFTVENQKAGNRPGGLVGAVYDTYRADYSNQQSSKSSDPNPSQSDPTIPTQTSTTPSANESSTNITSSNTSTNTTTSNTSTINTNTVSNTTTTPTTTTPKASSGGGGGGSSSKTTSDTSNTSKTFTPTTTPSTPAVTTTRGGEMVTTSKPPQTTPSHIFTQDLGYGAKGSEVITLHNGI